MVSLTDKRPDKLGFKARFESFFDTTSKIVNTSDRRNPVDEESTNQPDEALVSQDAQAGVQRVQATATVWTRSHLIGAHIW